MKFHIPVKSIRGQFMSAILICIAIPITLIFYFYYSSTEKVLMDEVDRSYKQLLQNQATQLEETAKRMLYAASMISNDTEVLQFLKMDANWLTDYDALQRYKAMNNRLSNTAMFMLDGSAVISLLDTRGYLFTNTRLYDSNRTRIKIKEYGWLDHPVVKEGYPYWVIAKAGQLDLAEFDSEEEMLVLVKDTREQLRRSYGVVMVAYPLGMNRGADASLQHGTALFLVGENAIVFGDPAKYKELFNGASGVESDHFVNSQLIDTIGWKLVQATPKGQFTGQLQKLRNRTMIWLFALFLLLFLLFIYLVLRITQPIKQLVQEMTRVALSGEGKVQGRKIEGAYELRLLHAHFMKMVSNLKEMMYNLSLEEKRKEKARYQALQSQIAPHFLFNALNSIKWSARLSGAEHVSHMINILGKLLSASMKIDREIIRLREELELVRYYVELQNVRFNHCIQLEIDVPDELMDIGVNKFLLQPLVENSIVHGAMFPQPLTIRIEARAEDGGVSIIVADNGKGLPEHAFNTKEALGNPESATEEAWEKSGGIGLTNIQERIHLYFGQQFGLSLQAGQEGGTVVHIRIPFQREVTQHA
jgi:sensor histidine kinase YesM